MNRTICVSLLVLLLASGCGKWGGSSEEAGEREGEHEGEGEHAGENHAGEGKHAGEGHANEVEMTQEALDLAGIRIAPAEKRALTGGVAIPAEVQFEPSSTAHVGPLVPGRITKVAVALGDRVERGQVLGQVASGDVSAARARLDQARARLSAAESTLTRQKQLSTEGIGAQKSLIDAEAEVGQLRAEVEGVRGQLAVFGSSGAGALLLTSPIDGVVVAVHATLGETVTPETPAFIVTDPTKVWVRGNVPELEISRLQAGSAVVVRIHAFPDLAMPGAISYVAPALDERSRSLPVRVTLTVPDARLRSGLFGSIELVGGTVDERVLVVPADAVATINGQTVVFVPADEPNTFQSLPIALGRRAGAFFEVRAGLKEGALLAVRGAFTLKSALQSGELSEGHEH